MKTKHLFSLNNKIKLTQFKKTLESMTHSRPVSEVLDLRPFTPLETLHSMVIDKQNELAQAEYELRYLHGKRLAGDKTVDQQISAFTHHASSIADRLNFFIRLRNEEVEKVKKMIEEEKAEKVVI